MEDVEVWEEGEIRIGQSERPEGCAGLSPLEGYQRQLIHTDIKEWYLHCC